MLLLFNRKTAGLLLWCLHVLGASLEEITPFLPLKDADICDLVNYVP